MHVQLNMGLTLVRGFLSTMNPNKHHIHKWFFNNQKSFHPKVEGAFCGCDFAMLFQKGHFGASVCGPHPHYIQKTCQNKTFAYCNFVEEAFGSHGAI